MTTDQNLPEPSGLKQKQIVHIIYGLFALGLISAGILSVAIIAAIVLCYLKRPEMIGTVYSSHIDWVVKTFWWGLLWLILSTIAALFFVGYVTGILALVWIVYRIAKGWLALFANETPVPGI